VDFQDRNAEVLGASFDDQDANARFAKKFSFPFPLLCDTERTLGIAYGACDSPDAKAPARISYLIGPDGRIRAAYSKVSPPTHPAEVLQELEGAGERPTVSV
jgi:peroxiredoxin Q/BCP